MTSVWRSTRSGGGGMNSPNGGPAGAAQGRITRGRTIRAILRAAPFLSVFWLLLSGRFEPLPLVLGALSVALVCWLGWWADLEQLHGVTIPVVLRLPRYFLWLGAKVIISALTVVRQVWSPRLALRPVVEPTPTHELTVLAQVIYANSITLTPGTISLDVDDERVLVHSLAAGDVEELRAGVLLEQVYRTGARS